MANKQHVNAKLDQTEKRCEHGSVSWAAWVHSNSNWSFVAVRRSDPSHRFIATVGNFLELCRRGSLLVRRRLVVAAHLPYTRRLSHSVRLFLSCTLVGLHVSEQQCQVGSMWPADESQRNTIRVVGPIATQDRSPIDGLPNRWFSSTTPLVFGTAGWASFGGSGDRSIEVARSSPYGSRLMPLG